MTIGILALQGAIHEHKRIIQQLGHQVIEVRKATDLDNIHGLILPGGESTTMSKLLVDFGLLTPIKKKIKQNLPILGTCAGLILLAKEIEGFTMPTLGVLDITVRRNAYGRQLGSFMVKEIIPAISKKPIPMTFIRAPFITKTADHVEVLHHIDGHIIAVRHQHIMGLSFHPELSNDTTIHEYFLNSIPTDVPLH